MINLYIKIKDGQCDGHPALESNLIEAFGAVPSDWEPFVRVGHPTPGVYEVLVSDDSTYSKVNGVWTDVWPVRDMTIEEKTAKQQAVKDYFNFRPQAENWSAWTFDEVTCTMKPPIPRPERNREKLALRISTSWCGAENNWKDTPPRPSDGHRYLFDFLAWQWVQVEDSESDPVLFINT